MSKKYAWKLRDDGKKNTGRPKKWDVRSIEEIKQEKKIEKLLKKKLSENKDIIIKSLINKLLGSDKTYKDEKEKRKDFLNKVKLDEDLSFFSNEVIADTLENTIDLEQFLSNSTQENTNCNHSDIFDYIDSKSTKVNSTCRHCSRIKKWTLTEWNLYIKSQNKKVAYAS